MMFFAKVFALAIVLCLLMNVLCTIMFDRTLDGPIGFIVGVVLWFCALLYGIYIAEWSKDL